MTDKEYVDGYAEGASEACRHMPEMKLPGTDRRGFRRGWTQAARAIARMNTRNLPKGQGRDRAMRKSISRVKRDRGYMHSI